MVVQFGDDHPPSKIRISSLIFGGPTILWKRFGEGSYGRRKIVIEGLKGEVCGSMARGVMLT